MRRAASHGRSTGWQRKVIDMSLQRPLPIVTHRRSLPAVLRTPALLALVSLLAASPLPVAAQHEHPEAGAEAAQTAKPSAELTPAELKAIELPADKSVEQTITVSGKTLHYTATVGTIRLTDDKGKPTGDVMYTSYVLDHEKGAPDRPVLFAVNGGPGASSVYLNLGAIGPKHLAFADQGDSASDPAALSDNPGTWLDFADEVFIDPIGTGFSRALVPEAQAKKLFYAPTPDIQYLSLVIYKWLVKNERLLDKKYLIGESYGGYRVPRMTHYMQSTLGVAMNGIILVSPYLNPSFGNGNLSPIPWMITLPSITAAYLERQHKLSDAAMQPVIAYTEGDYAEALIKGPADKTATDAMIAKVTEMTGLDAEFVKYSGGRLSTEAYLREVHREQGTIGSVYDSNVTLPDPFPYAPYQQSSDPILESIVAPVTTAMVNFITNTVGWKTDAQYYALSYQVNRDWDRSGPTLREGAVDDLREAMAADPKMDVLVVHGWDDLSCPFMGSLLTQNELPAKLASQFSVHEFPGGHMFYSRWSNGKKLHELGEGLVENH